MGADASFLQVRLVVSGSELLATSWPKVGRPGTLFELGMPHTGGQGDGACIFSCMALACFPTNRERSSRWITRKRCRYLNVAGLDEACLLVSRAATGAKLIGQ
jgi:hypothetical protein